MVRGEDGRECVGLGCVTNGYGGSAEGPPSPSGIGRRWCGCEEGRGGQPVEYDDYSMARATSRKNGRKGHELERNTRTRRAVTLIREATLISIIRHVQA
jgi:hypothetical protein